MAKKTIKSKITNSDASKVEIIKQGLQTEFWKIIVEIMEESKQYIQNQQDGADIKDLPAELYKLQNELFKAKKDLIDKLINAPQNMMDWFSKPVNERKNFDPYDQE